MTHGFSADLILVGFGNVGRRFVRLLNERAGELQAAHGLDWRVVAIATGRHGAAADLSGLDVDRALRLVEGGESLEGLVQAPKQAPARPSARAQGAQASRPAQEQTLAPPRGGSSAEFIARVAGAARASGSGRQLVVVETTVLDVRAGQPAIDHVRAGLTAGAHVITANKGPVAFAYAELRDLARAAGVSFLHEGAVMDGIPIFNMARAALPAVRIEGFAGIVNSTTNFIITAMENGREFAEALAEMQEAGIAEADASLDVDGWDAAAKAAALANVLMDAGTTPLEVDRSGIGQLSVADVKAAVESGRRLKLVARGRRAGEAVSVRVAVEAVAQNHLFATLEGQQNALVLETDLLGEFAIVQLGGGLTQTAYALVADLVEVGRSRRAGGLRPEA